MESSQQMQEFRTIVKKSIGMSTTLFIIIGVLGILMGGGMIVAYFATAWSAEPMPIVLLIIGAVFVIWCILLIIYARQQKANTLWLLFDRTDDIQDIHVIKMQRGVMTVCALHFIDKDQSKRGVMVPSEEYAEAIKRMYLG